MKEFIIFQDSLHMIDVRNLFEKKSYLTIEYVKIKPLNGRNRVKVSANK